MKLYLDPISTTCRPIYLFLEEHDVDAEIVPVNLMGGEHQADAYAALNPNRAVPTLTEGDFVLTESSAILKYLAEKAGSATYPADLQGRARVNQLMDWFNTGFYKDFGYGVVYAQVFPHHRYADEGVQDQVVGRATERAGGWLNTLETRLLTEKPYLGGDAPCLADYQGASYLTIADWVGFDLAPWPRTQRWVEAMRARPSWGATHGPFDGVTAYFRNPQPA